LYFLVFVFLTIGGFSVVAAIVKLPPKAVGVNLQKMYINRLPFLKRLELEILTPFIKPVSKLIPLSERTRAFLEADLARAGIPYSPCEYYARAFVLSLFSLPLPFLVWTAGISFAIPVTIAMPFLLFRKFSVEHKDVLSKKRKSIELALPHFVRSVLYRLDNGDGTVQVDVVAIFEDYIKISVPALEYDIKLLVTEMKAGGVTKGLHNFEHRLNMPEIGFLVRAAIGIYNGQPQASALAALSRDIDVRARENLKRELDKQPGKIKRATIPLVAVGIAALVYVLGYHLWISSSGLF
jgi:hypothetical protein